MRVSLHRLAGSRCVALLARPGSTAQAQGKGHGKEHGDDHAQARATTAIGTTRRDDPRYEHRDHVRPRVTTRTAGASRPAWPKKPGGMPPGQYKKLYTTRQGASVLSDVLGRHGYQSFEPRRGRLALRVLS